MAFNPLSEEDYATLESDRALVRVMLTDQGLGKFTFRPATDISEWQSALDGRLLGPLSETMLEAFGTVLGDALCDSLGMKWVRVVDDYGSDLALRSGETSLTVFPRDMIVKRVEQHEHPDLQHLHDGVVETIQRLEASGEYK